MIDWLLALWTDINGNVKYAIVLAVAVFILSGVTALAKMLPWKKLVGVGLLFALVLAWAVLATFALGRAGGLINENASLKQEKEKSDRQLAELLSGRRVHATGIGPDSSRADRHLTHKQHEDMLAALRKHPAGPIAIYTLKGKEERIRFAAEIAAVFSEAGWTLLERGPDVGADHVNLIERLDSPEQDKSGVLLPYLPGGIPLGPQFDVKVMDAVVAALEAAKLKHTQVRLQTLSPFYVGQIDSTKIVLLVGPVADKAEP